jgi:hypothetical protein
MLKQWNYRVIIKKWAPKPKKHLEKAKERAATHDVRCFDHNTSKYQVMERGGTTSDGEVWPSRSYIMVLSDFSCRCGRPRQYHSPCSHYIVAARHRNFDYETKIPWEFSVDSLVLTWLPHFEPYLNEGQWPEHTGPRYIADPGTRWDKRGTRKRTRHRMVMDQVSGRMRRGRVSDMKIPGYPTDGEIRHPLRLPKPHRRPPSKVDSPKAQTARQLLVARATNSILPEPCREVSGKMSTSGDIFSPRPSLHGVIKRARPPQLTSASLEGHV